MTTYGWAILIIAAVLVVLVSLGVFNTSSYSSGAAPGGCQVYRLRGPATTQQINLEGVCGGELPRTTAWFNNSYGTITINALTILDSNTVTVTAWVKLSSNSNWVLISRGSSGVSGSYAIFGNPTTPDFRTTLGVTNYNTNFGSGALNTSTWYFLAATFNPLTGNAVTYIDGKALTTGTNVNLGTPTFSNGNFVIGAYPGASGYSLTGFIANIQIYNRSLPANNILALYYAGLGAPPGDLQHLVGWWPLNGDTNDYSGNNNNAVANSISFTSTWTSGYTQP